MTILVTGANGQIGNEMRIESKSSGDSGIQTSLSEEFPGCVSRLAYSDLDTNKDKKHVCS